MPKKTINHHVGRRLRLRRTALGLSQDAVGKGIGVASQQVQKYEKGTNVMNVNRLYQFAKFLRVPVSYFFDEADVTLASASAKKDVRHTASDREALEIAKSFKRIKDRALRKRLADLARVIALKNGAKQPL